MAAPPTEHEILDVNRRYHDVAADSYDSKWGISFGEIGHQQVMIDDDDVGLLSTTPGVEHETVIEPRAFGSETVVACRSDPRPHRIRVAELSELGDVTLPRGARPLAHFREPARNFLAQAARDSLLLGELESVQT